MSASLSHQLQLLVTPTYTPSPSTYIDLLRESVRLREFRAAVFIFDQIKSRGSTPTEEVYEILEQLHSKTLPESSGVRVPLLDPGAKTLAPRRRIHKIIKGWRQKKTNLVATQYLAKVQGFLGNQPEYKSLPRIKLARKIEKGCRIDFETSRRIVTKLKQTGYLPKDVKAGGQGGQGGQGAPRMCNFDWGAIQAQDKSPQSKENGPPSTLGQRQTRLDRFFL